MDRSNRLTTLLVLLAGVLGASACASSSVEPCQEETLVGAWKAEWTDEVWTFEADGRLLCEGVCYYGTGTGQPKGWGYEPEANVWSQPLDYIKLVFTEKTFGGTLGAYRCQVSPQGTKLTLMPFKGEDLVFDRVETN